MLQDRLEGLMLMSVKRKILMRLEKEKLTEKVPRNYQRLFYNKFINRLYITDSSFRGCSYGGELARLGGMAHLGEISSSLRNSYKNIIDIMCSLISFVFFRC